MDPATPMTLVNDIPQTPEGQADVKTLASSLLNGSQRLPVVDQLLAEAPERLKQPLMDTALTYLNSENLGDPDKWLAMAAKAPQGQEAIWTQRVVTAWAENEPAEAVAWASALPQ